MRKCRLVPLLLALSLVAAAHFGASGQPGVRRRQAVRQIDRILVESTDPRELYDLFTGLLQLPVSWPLADNGGFTSGAFGTGNLNIEVFRSAPKTPSRRASPRAQFAGLAFEPYAPLPEVLPELETRGVSHSQPEPYVSTLPDRSQGVVWTTVVLDGLAAPGMRVFLFQYSPAFLNVHVRRNQLAGQLALRKGGPLGIVSVLEVVVGTRDLKNDAARWQRLLPAAVAPGLWKAGSGPALRLTADSETRIRRVVFEVRSLERARAYLAANKLLGPAAGGQISIEPARVQGLSLRLAATPEPRQR